MHGEESAESQTQVKTSAPRDVQTPRKRILKRTGSTTEDYDRLLNPLPPPKLAKSPTIPAVRPEDVTSIEDGPLLKVVMKSLIRSKAEVMHILQNDPKVEEELYQLELKQNLVIKEDEDLKKSLQDCDLSEQQLAEVVSRILGDPTTSNSLEESLQIVIAEYERKKAEVNQLSLNIKQIEQELKEKEKEYNLKREGSLSAMSNLKNKRQEAGRSIEDIVRQSNTKDRDIFSQSERLDKSVKIGQSNQKVIEAKQDRLENLKRDDEEKSKLMNEKKKPNPSQNGYTQSH